MTAQVKSPKMAKRYRGLVQESQLSQEAVNFHAPFAASVIYHQKSRGKEKERSPNQGSDLHSLWVKHFGSARMNTLAYHIVLSMHMSLPENCSDFLCPYAT